MRILPKPIAFEWDKGNINKNFIKHNVTDKEAEEKRLELSQHETKISESLRFINKAKKGKEGI